MRRSYVRRKPAGSRSTGADREIHGPDAPAGAADRDSAPPLHTGPFPASAGPEPPLGAAVGRVATWTLRLLVIAAGLWLLAWALGRLWVVVLPLALGLLLATVLWPPASLLRRWLPPAAAALLVLVGALALLVGLGATLAPQVASQSEALADAVVEGLANLQALAAGPPLNLDEDQLRNLFDQAIAEVRANANSIAGGVLTGVSTAGGFVLNAVLAVVLCFFFIKDGPKFIPWVSALVGPRAAPHVAELSRRTWTTLSGFIKAQAVVGLVDAVAIGIGLAVLGVPLALPLAVLVFFGAFIPIVGAFVTGALAALVALVTNGVTSALIVVALVVAVQQLEGNVLQPILVGRTLDLHAALVILAVTAGGSLAGIAGAFLAVPLLAVGTAMVRYARQQLDAVHARGRQRAAP